MSTYNLNLYNRVSLIAAVSLNGWIGKGGKLPWNSKSDLAWFKSVTMGKPVVMGRKTYESLGKPLAGRLNIVVTRDPAKQTFKNEHPSVYFAGSVSEALMMADLHHMTEQVSEIMVIGGGEIYEQALPFAQTVYLTRIQLIVEGDTRFPDIEAGWLCSIPPVLIHKGDGSGDPSFEVHRYVRSAHNAQKETEEGYTSSHTPPTTHDIGFKPLATLKGWLRRLTGRP